MDNIRPILARVLSSTIHPNNWSNHPVLLSRQLSQSNTVVGQLGQRPRIVPIMIGCDVLLDSWSWYSDGDIVLLAREGTTAFRVHKSTLALHSEFFTGMFEHSLPAPHGPDEPQIDGCPIIRLHDTAHDIRELLRVMYDPNRLQAPEGVTFPILAALIRVGHKYGAHDVVKECSPHLLSMVPATLKEYDTASKHRAAIQFTPHHAPEALHVFRLIDLADDPRTHAFLLFLCAQLEERDLHNRTRLLPGDLEALSSPDVERILALKWQLQWRARKAWHDTCTFDLPAHDCENRNASPCAHQTCRDRNHNCRVNECVEDYKYFVDSRIPCSVKYAYFQGDPFGAGLLDRLHQVRGAVSVCRWCAKGKLAEQDQFRGECWEALPVLAGSAK